MTSYYKNEKTLNSMLKNIKIKLPKSNFNNNFNFKSINPDSTQLFTLIVSEENGAISCSQSDITLHFGSHISSLIKGNFSIYILSIINQKLYPSITFEINEETGLPETKYDKNIIINNEIEPNELFSINIKMPEKKEKDDEEFEFTFKLKLTNDNLSELILPFSFKFILSSLQIRIECFNYKLIIQDNELQLGSLFLEENEKISFKVECLNLNTHIDFKISYKGNNDNEAKEPKLTQNSNLFDIELANEYNNIDITEQNFSLKLFSSIFYVYISNDIFIPIILKAKILPFKFKISAYDFYHPENPVKNEIIKYYGNNHFGKEQKLFFKINMPENNREYKGNIKINNDNKELKITKISIEDEFKISQSTTFNVEYIIKYSSLKDIIINIIININSFIQTFRVIYRQSPPIVDDRYSIINFKIYPTYIPLYIYELDKHGKYNLRQLNNPNFNEKPTNNIFVTPYDISELSPINIKDSEIEFLINSSNKVNKFYVINYEGTINILNKNTTNYEFSENPYTYYYCGYQQTTYKFSVKTLPLIGEYNDIWYPLINNFKLPINQSIKLDFYKYNDSSNNAKKFVNLFEETYSIPSGFNAIGNFLIQDKVFDHIDEIIDSLPDSLSSNIYQLIKLKHLHKEVKEEYKESGMFEWFKDKKLIKDTIYEMLLDKNKKIILKNNILIALFLILKNRYNELKTNGFRDFIIKEIDAKERLNKKVKEMREKYFCLNHEPKIKDRFEIKDELYLTKRFTKDLEKENKSYLNKNDANSFKEIKYIHYNNNSYYNNQKIKIINSNFNNKSPSSMMITSEIILPKLIRPEKDFTLNNLIKFYNDAIKVTRILPIFIRSVLKNNDEEQKKEEEDCFSLLINSYKAFKPNKNSSYKDISFLNYYVNDFIDSFEKMISKLKGSGFNTLGLGLESIQVEENTNEILKIPEYEIIDEKDSFWNNYTKKDFNDINKPFYDTVAYNKTLQENKDILKNNDYDASTYESKVDIINSNSSSNKPKPKSIPKPKTDDQQIQKINQNKTNISSPKPSTFNDDEQNYDVKLPNSIDDTTFVKLVINSESNQTSKKK